MKGNSANTPELWAPALEDEFPVIEHAVRFMQGFTNTLIIASEQRFLEERGLYADASVFDVFSWPLLKGNPESALGDPFSIVLSEKLARNFFGDAAPIGQVLPIAGISNDSGRRDYKVNRYRAECAASFPYSIRFSHLIRNRGRSERRR